MNRTAEVRYRIPPLKSFSELQLLSCSGNRAFSPHIHSGYVIWLSSGGGESFSINRQSSVLQPGYVGIVEPGVVHENRAFGTERHLRSFYFPETFFEDVLNKLEAKSPPLKTGVVGNTALWNSLVDLHNSVFSDAGTLSIEEKILACFSKLLQKNAVPETVSGKDDRRIKIIIDYFHENAHRPVSLSELEGLVDCTAYHIIRLFKKHTGLTAHAYLKQLRLEKARSLLDNDLPITEAALASGFSDQSHLTNSFKARYGLSPGRYRLNLK